MEPLGDQIRAELSRVGADSGAAGPRVEQEQVISAELRKRLADLLRDDVARFRAHMPPDFDGWGLA